MKKIPQNWHEFIDKFQQQFHTEIVYNVVRVFKNEEEIEERYTTYEFADYLPNYIPIADDSGGQVAVISTNEKDTNVYLTSYGTLIESNLEILANDLNHWKNRKFSFQSITEKMKHQEAELYISNIGPNKMKIVSLLKENFNLSGTEALQMSKQERIFFRKSYLKWIEKDVKFLENLGATVEIVNV